ncbi:hypothetical protein NL676_030935 [Syzygium grande]|nr:hypothetical protein NL676_030935 [Syzygium grande]
MLDLSPRSRACLSPPCPLDGGDNKAEWMDEGTMEKDDVKKEVCGTGHGHDTNMGRSSGGGCAGPSSPRSTTTTSPPPPPPPPPPPSRRPTASSRPPPAPPTAEPRRCTPTRRRRPPRRRRSGPAKRKRGRPRKYGTPEQALAAKKAAGSSSSSSYKERKERGGLVGSSSSGPYSGSSKKSQSLALGGNTGQGFIPHVITVAAGEDVAQKIMLFMQQSKREICILSASGSISNASLRQPATSGGNITYEGRFEIITLSGSYVLTELGGRTGGLSVCLSSTDGQIIGGGVGGPLLAAGPVQVIVGSFLVNAKNNTMKGNASGSASRIRFSSFAGNKSRSFMGDSPTRSPIVSCSASLNYSGALVPEAPAIGTEVKGVTKETNVSVKINLDWTGVSNSSIGIPFLDHMLDRNPLTTTAYGGTHPLCQESNPRPIPNPRIALNRPPPKLHRAPGLKNAKTGFRRAPATEKPKPHSGNNESSQTTWVRTSRDLPEAIGALAGDPLLTSSASRGQQRWRQWRRGGRVNGEEEEEGEGRRREEECGGP